MMNLIHFHSGSGHNNSFSSEYSLQKEGIGPNPQTQRGIARHGKSIENVKSRSDTKNKERLIMFVTRIQLDHSKENLTRKRNPINER